jgi:hypothetical protein
MAARKNRRSLGRGYALVGGITAFADIDVADALLSHAADSGADFMVMGGREFVLGGVTVRYSSR